VSVWILVPYSLTYLQRVETGGSGNPEAAAQEVTVMEKRNKLWVLLGILILALLNFPLLTIVNRDLCYGGIPLLIYYFFGVWLLAIGILAWGSRFLAP
jgi:hypothetical protein